jgi:hypothetical protein
MTSSPGTTAALHKTCTAWAPPRREAAGEALPDDEPKAGVLGPEPGGEPDDPEDDEDDDGDDKPADDDDDELDDEDELDDDDDEPDGWSPAPA